MITDNPDQTPQALPNPNLVARESIYRADNIYKLIHREIIHVMDGYEVPEAFVEFEGVALEIDVQTQRPVGEKSFPIWGVARGDVLGAIAAYPKAFAEHMKKLKEREKQPKIVVPDGMNRQMRRALASQNGKH